MATESLTEKIKVSEKLFDEANKGHSSEAILRILDPLLDARLGKLLSDFEKCVPELGQLLDLRAKITEIWRMRRDLSDGVKLGLSAQKLLEGMLHLK